MGRVCLCGCQGTGLLVPCDMRAAPRVQRQHPHNHDMHRPRNPLVRASSLGLRANNFCCLLSRDVRIARQHNYNSRHSSLAVCLSRRRARLRTSLRLLASDIRIFAPGDRLHFARVLSREAVDKPLSVDGSHGRGGNTTKGAASGVPEIGQVLTARTWGGGGNGGELVIGLVLNAACAGACLGLLPGCGQGA